MATITNEQFHQMKKLLMRRDSTAKSEVLSSGVDRAALTAGFQAIEDFWTANQVSIKADIDAAMGITSTNVLAKKLGKAWMEMKWSGE